MEYKVHRDLPLILHDDKLHTFEEVIPHYTGYLANRSVPGV